MKRIAILTSFLTMALAIVWAQPPHKEVGYDASSNVLTTVSYGYGNSVDQIIQALDSPLASREWFPFLRMMNYYLI